MLRLKIASGIIWNESTEEFESLDKDYVLNLEHSLAAISKWESKYKKPFLCNEEKTKDELLYYIKCMNLDENTDDEVYSFIRNSDISKVLEYAGERMTATTFTDLSPQRPNREIITAEIIYYWMIRLGIPMECEKWHLDKLLTLIRVCNIKDSPPKKMSKRDVLRQYSSINNKRRKVSGSKG